jgi:hypothetical protein
MSRGQAATLRTLAVEVYQPKLLDENLTREEADRRIEALREEIALAFTKRRLLDLAANYDKRLMRAGPSASTRVLKAPLHLTDTQKQI